MFTRISNVHFALRMFTLRFECSLAPHPQCFDAQMPKLWTGSRRWLDERRLGRLAGCLGSAHSTRRAVRSSLWRLPLPLPVPCLQPRQRGLVLDREEGEVATHRQTGRGPRALPPPLSVPPPLPDPRQPLPPSPRLAWRWRRALERALKEHSTRRSRGAN